MNTILELLDIIRYDLFGASKSSIFIYRISSSKFALLVTAVLFLSLPFHFLAPLWIFIVVIFPYSMAWLFYFLYAQNGRKTLLPLYPIDPVKVYKVNRAFIESLLRICKSPIKSIILKNLWNKSNPESSEEFLVLSGLDFGSKENSKIDVYYKGNPHIPVEVANELVKPVVIFIQGGGWRGSRRSAYRTMAKSLVDIGYIVAVPDYATWPKVQNASLMVHDVTRSIQWTLENIRHYGGDPSSITVVAHGAGAHLTAVALISNAVTASEYQEANREAGFSQPDIYPTQDIIVRNPSAPSFFKLAGVVFIGGIFDLEEQLESEQLRGVDELSCLERLFGFEKSERNEFSPNILISRALTSMASNKIIHHLPQSWLFFHNLHNELVPYKQCSDFFDYIEETGILNISLKSYNSSDQCDFIYDLFLGETECLQQELVLLRERKNHIARYKRWLAAEHRRPSRNTFTEFRNQSSRSSSYYADVLR